MTKGCRMAGFGCFSGTREALRKPERPRPQAHIARLTGVVLSTILCVTPCQTAMPARKPKSAPDYRPIPDEEKRRRITGANSPVVTARSAEAARAPEVTREAISALRSKLGLSQPVFAQALNVSAETVRSWEQGKRLPDGAAARLLELVSKNPRLLLDSIQRREFADE